MTTTTSTPSRPLWTRTIAATVVAVATSAAVGCATLPLSGPAGGDVTPPATPATPATLAARQLAELQVVVEDTGAHYDRDDWPHWRTQNGCDTRDRVLREQGQTVQVAEKCTVVAGTWESLYDARTVTAPGVLEIDHVVPLAEVARSGRVVDGQRVGPRSWTRDQRAAYANDPAVLLAVTAASHGPKRDSDPADWLPRHGQARYAALWIEIKWRYDLSLDPAEHDTLVTVLTACGDVTPPPACGVGDL